MIDLTEKNDTLPICPHCDHVLSEIWYRELKGFLGKRYIYFCSKCRKTLGVTHRKGFFMG